jgi:membrane protein
VKRFLDMLKQAVSDFIQDDALTLAGALAFYTALSLAPLIMLMLTLTALLGESARDQLVREIAALVGPHAGEGIEFIVESAEEEKEVAGLAGIIGIAILLFSATTVFAQLQYSLNRIWNVRHAPGAGLWAWIRKRILSLGMILAISFLLLVSMALNAMLALLFPQTGVLWQIVNFVVSMIVFVLLFTLMFKHLPDVQITWKSAWLGGVMTAVLFAIGKFLIGLYLGHTAVESSYGAAGSLILLLLWVYYSALIVFFGGELTQVYARQTGQKIRPEEHAEWAPELKNQPPGKPHD